MTIATITTFSSFPVANGVADVIDIVAVAVAVAVGRCFCTPTKMHLAKAEHSQLTCILLNTGNTVVVLRMYCSTVVLFNFIITAT